VELWHCNWEKITGKVLTNLCQNGNAVKISIRSYLNKYLWILQLLHSKPCLWNNNFTNWKSLASLIKCTYTSIAGVCYQSFMHESLCTSWFWWEMKNWGLIEGTWIWKKKGNIWFQKAEAEIEATPVLFFHTSGVANQFVKQQAIKFQHVILREPRAAEVVRGRSSSATEPARVRPRLSGMLREDVLPDVLPLRAAPALAAALPPRSSESGVICGRRMVCERMRLLCLVHVILFSTISSRRRW